MSCSPMGDSVANPKGTMTMARFVLIDPDISGIRQKRREIVVAYDSAGIGRVITDLGSYERGDRLAQSALQYDGTIEGRVVDTEVDEEMLRNLVQSADLSALDRVWDSVSAGSPREIDEDEAERVRALEQWLRERRCVLH